MSDKKTIVPRSISQVINGSFEFPSAGLYLLFPQNGLLESASCPRRVCTLTKIIMPCVAIHHSCDDKCCNDAV